MAISIELFGAFSVKGCKKILQEVENGAVVPKIQMPFGEALVIKNQYTNIDALCNISNLMIQRSKSRMFGIIRLIFWSISYIVCLLFMRKSIQINKYKHRWYFGTLIIAGILCSLSALVPVENAFVTFSSPEAAFSYVNTDNVKLIVNGTKTDLVIGKEKEGYIYAIIPKSDNGWKLGLALGTKLITHNISPGGVVFHVYQYKDSEEYYITVYNTNGAAAEVSDSRNSKFYHMDKSSNGDNETFYTYYVYVHNLDDEYTLTVNGETISVMDEQN